MMKIEFDTSNEAFAEDLHGEIGIVIEEFAATIEGKLRAGRTDGPIWDVNGNRIGSWSFKQPKDAE